MICEYRWADPAVHFFYFLCGDEVFTFASEDYDVDNDEVTLCYLNGSKRDLTPTLLAKFHEAADILSDDSKTFWGFPEKIIFK